MPTDQAAVIYCARAHTHTLTHSHNILYRYSGRSWADRGNSITNSHFERIRNYGAPIPLQAQNVVSVHVFTALRLVLLYFLSIFSLFFLFFLTF